MKKSIKLALVGALAVASFSTSAFAAKNQIDVVAEVSPYLVAGFEELTSVDATGANANSLIDSVENTFNLGAYSPDTGFASPTKDLFVKTNIDSNITMTIDGGDLTGTNTGTTIPLEVSFNGAAVTMGTGFTISSGMNEGATSTGAIKIGATTTIGQVLPADSYYSALAVTIAAQ